MPDTQKWMAVYRAQTAGIEKRDAEIERLKDEVALLRDQRDRSDNALRICFAELEAEKSKYYMLKMAVRWLISEGIIDISDINGRPFVSTPDDSVGDYLPEDRASALTEAIK